MKRKNTALVILGALIQAAGISSIHALSGVTEGGVLGLTLLIHHWTGLSPAVSSLLLNGACYVLGWRTLGRDFLLYSLVGSIAYSLFYALLEPLSPLFPWLLPSPIACAVAGAVFVGVGVGLGVRGGGALSGDDALAMSLAHLLRKRIQWIYLFSDLTVLLLSLSYIPFQRIAYSLLTVMLSGQIIGLLQPRKKAP